VFTINGFSAHAGQDQLLDWLTHFQNKKMQIFLVHGEISVQDHLASLIRERFGFAVTIPEYLEEINLRLGAPIQEFKKPQAAAPKINWELLLGDLGSKISRLSAQQEKLKSLPASKQIEIKNLLQEANQRINNIKSDS
jgi:metallo-beta-lactamase family protein